VSDKAQRTVRIKWIRSGIGFDHHQKRIVRSLGLRKLNQEVEKPDTPQIRGLVAKVPHLLKIVEAPKKPAWTLVQEYSIHLPAAASAGPVETAGESPAVEEGKPQAPAAPAELQGASQRDSKPDQNEGEAPPVEAGAGTTGEFAAPASEPASLSGEGSGSTNTGPSPSEGQS